MPSKTKQTSKPKQPIKKIRKKTTIKPKKNNFTPKQKPHQQIPIFSRNHFGIPAFGHDFPRFTPYQTRRFASLFSRQNLVARGWKTH